MKVLLILVSLILLESCFFPKAESSPTDYIYELKCYAGSEKIYQYVGTSPVTYSEGIFIVNEPKGAFKISLGCILKEGY